MPFVRIDMIEGRSEAEITAVLDAVHGALVAALAIPERDRYQVAHEHRRTHMVVQDSGLGITRTDKALFITITSRPRKDESKRLLFVELTERLKRSSGIESNDVMVTLVTNSDTDWSFGYGRAQFITREL